VSEHIEDQSQYEAMQEDLTAIALGILSGRRRSEVLNHVEGCLRCSSELEQLSTLADTILQLAPEADPPIGFELRLAERLGTNVVRRSPRSRRFSALAIAAAIVVVLGISVQTLIATRGNDGQSKAITASLTSATYSSHRQRIGEVLVSAGSPSWMYMMVDKGSWSGVVTCEVTLDGGKVEKIGKFKLSGGYGDWIVPLKSSPRQIRSASLVGANGVVLASARFTD
jgi:hypothetical protein